MTGRMIGGGEAAELDDVRGRVASAATRLGVGRVRMLVGKPGLDGHSNAAEQIAVRARDAGMVLANGVLDVTHGMRCRGKGAYCTFVHVGYIWCSMGRCSV